MPVRCHLVQVEEQRLTARRLQLPPGPLPLGPLSPGPLPVQQLAAGPLPVQQLAAGLRAARMRVCQPPVRPAQRAREQAQTLFLLPQLPQLVQLSPAQQQAWPQEVSPARQPVSTERRCHSISTVRPRYKGNEGVRRESGCLVTTAVCPKAACARPVPPFSCSVL